MSDSTTPANPAAHPAWFLDPRLSHKALALCAVAATGHTLGATWLSMPVMGLPAGLWLIGMGLGSGPALRAARQLGLTRSEPSKSAAHDAAAAGSVPTGRAWPKSKAARTSADAVVGALASTADLAQRCGMSGLNEVSAWHDRLPWPVRPVRIGLKLDEYGAAAIEAAPGAIACEWVRLDQANQSPRQLCRAHRLDAIVCEGESGLEVITPEASGHEASWYDWSQPRPLSYSSVFPMRIDCARVSLAGLSLRVERQATLARSLAESAAVLARLGPRLTLADRFNGRCPVRDPGAKGFETARVSRPDPAEACLKDLVFRMQSFEPATLPVSAQRAAARVVSAWLATRPLATDIEADIAARRRGMEDAAQVAGDEPEVMLRLAAVRFAAMDDDAAYDALWRADRILRDRQTLPGTDQLAFLQAELDLAPCGPMTLGRAAAGICLLCSTTPPERIPYLRDDLVDDMRYSRWLVGRDQDRATLLEVFRRLERTRRAERMGLPAALAA